MMSTPVGSRPPLQQAERRQSEEEKLSQEGASLDVSNVPVPSRGSCSASSSHTEPLAESHDVEALSQISEEEFTYRAIYDGVKQKNLESVRSHLRIFVESGDRKGLKTPYYEMSIFERLIRENDLDSIKWVMQKRLHQSLSSNEFKNEVYIALAVGSPEIVDFLISKQSTIKDQKDEREISLLQKAIELENIEVVKVLLKHNVNCHVTCIEDGYRFLPLSYCVKRGLKDVFDLLSRKMVETAHFSAAIKGNIPNLGNLFHVAIHFNQHEMISWLLDRSCKEVHELLEVMPNGVTPLQYAATKDALKAIVAILEKDPNNLEVQDAGRKTALYHAIISNQKEAVMLLLSFGAQIDPSCSADCPNEEIRSILTAHASTGSTKRPNLTTIPPQNIVFSGGGIKGISYLGALESFLDPESNLFRGVQRYAGTSAGAITATLLSIGCDLETTQKELEGLDFTNFLRPDDAFLERFGSCFKDDSLSNLLKAGDILEIFKVIFLEKKGEILKQGITRAASSAGKTLSTPVIKLMKMIEEKSGLNAFKRTLADLGVIKRGMPESSPAEEEAALNWFFEIIDEILVNVKGVCSSDGFRDWISAIVERQTGIPDCSFEELKRKVAEDPRKFKHLHLFATKTGQNEIVRFSSEHEQFKDYIIADVVTASMSIPVIFQPRKLRLKGSAAQDSAEYIDGGLLKNFPVRCFDNKAYTNQKGSFPEGIAETQDYNYRTIGFRFIEPQSSHSKSASSFLLSIVKFYYGGEAVKDESDGGYGDRVIAIDTGDFALSKLSVTLEEKATLIAAGRSAATRFLSGQPPKSEQIERLSQRRLEKLPQAPCIGDLERSIHRLANILFGQRAIADLRDPLRVLLISNQIQDLTPGRALSAEVGHAMHALSSLNPVNVETAIVCGVENIEEGNLRFISSQIDILWKKIHEFHFPLEGSSDDRHYQMVSASDSSIIISRAQSVMAAIRHALIEAISRRKKLALRQESDQHKDRADKFETLAGDRQEENRELKEVNRQLAAELRRIMGEFQQDPIALANQALQSELSAAANTSPQFPEFLIENVSYRRAKLLDAQLSLLRALSEADRSNLNVGLSAEQKTQELNRYLRNIQESNYQLQRWSALEERSIALRVSYMLGIRVLDIMDIDVQDVGFLRSVSYRKDILTRIHSSFTQDLQAIVFGKKGEFWVSHRKSPFVIPGESTKGALRGMISKFIQNTGKPKEDFIRSVHKQLLHKDGSTDVEIPVRQLSDICSPGDPEEGPSDLFLHEMSHIFDKLPELFPQHLRRYTLKIPDNFQEKERSETGMQIFWAKTFQEKLRQIIVPILIREWVSISNQKLERFIASKQANALSIEHTLLYEGQRKKIDLLQRGIVKILEREKQRTILTEDEKDRYFFDKIFVDTLKLLGSHRKELLNDPLANVSDCIDQNDKIINKQTFLFLHIFSREFEHRLHREMEIDRLISQLIENLRDFRLCVLVNPDPTSKKSTKLLTRTELDDCKLQ